MIWKDWLKCSGIPAEALVFEKEGTERPQRQLGVYLPWGLRSQWDSTWEAMVVSK